MCVESEDWSGRQQEPRNDAACTVTICHYLESRLSLGNVQVADSQRRRADCRQGPVNQSCLALFASRLVHDAPHALLES
ncbi:hypothetical protein PybrP1_010643 [[Pythium] brassicae (nom. inval.)]|nr:hypothetical protein PybrP1_010643 [[Pythium] brassicae (nom. inval.)]